MAYGCFEENRTKPWYIEQRFSENSPLDLKKNHCCSIVHKFVPCKVDFQLSSTLPDFEIPYVNLSAAPKTKGNCRQ